MTNIESSLKASCGLRKEDIWTWELRRKGECTIRLPLGPLRLGIVERDWIWMKALGRSTKRSHDTLKHFNDSTNFFRDHSCGKDIHLARLTRCRRCILNLKCIQELGPKWSIAFPLRLQFKKRLGFNGAQDFWFDLAFRGPWGRLDWIWRSKRRGIYKLLTQLLKIILMTVTDHSDITIPSLPKRFTLASSEVALRPEVCKNMIHVTQVIAAQTPSRDASIPFYPSTNFLTMSPGSLRNPKGYSDSIRLANIKPWPCQVSKISCRDYWKLSLVMWNNHHGYLCVL